MLQLNEHYIYYLVSNGENNLVTLQDMDEDYQSYGSFFILCDKKNKPFSLYILTAFFGKRKKNFPILSILQKTE